MKLEIVTIADRGVANKERLHLRATADANLSYFIVFKSIITSPESVSSAPQNTYWFPGKFVKAGDHIVLYSGLGQPSESKNADGTNNHFFYWNIKNTIWNNTADCAVVFEVNTWQTIK